MKSAFFCAALCALFFAAAAQENRDTTQKLEDVTVRAYFSSQPILRSPVSVSVLNEAELNKHPGVSLVSAINTIPGVRMEERSPGSYRLSIRGSLLRSPFGIRNVKIYLDDFPLTDAGGNSYLNLLDASGVNRLEILKGPEASIFGANSGGAILISSNRLHDFASTGITAGSYGLLHQKAAIQKSLGSYSININEGYQRADGYRENSALQRKFLNLNQRWAYSPKGALRSTLIYSNLHYETPGGLTAAQADANPQAARPAAGKIPGALEQKAGIYNKTLFAGLLNEINLSNNLRQVTAVFGSATNFLNPFITNYEERKEATLGLRTFTELKGGTASLQWALQTGLEAQRTHSNISNYDNKAGSKAAQQSADKLLANQDFIFSHASVDIDEKLSLEAAASISFYNYLYRSLFPTQIAERLKRFNAALMPRFAASYKLNDNLALRASASRGYSAPTIAEVRASDNVINTNLQPESGWNYETGLRFSGMNNRFSMDAVVFDFRLHNAIVRRLNSNATEYFVNAGGTKQQGFEWQFMGWLISPKAIGFLRGLQIQNSYTLSRFYFQDYKNAALDYSGNRLTGVPKQTVLSSINLLFPKSIGLFIQHNYTSKIPLNDANSFFAKSYNLVEAKASWHFKQFQLNAGADNLLNKAYSLGNDLNAVGNRYFNPAPLRNFYLGIAVNWQRLAHK